MRLFVGLGNPGQKYQGHRHNIGFMAMDEICHRHKFSGWDSKFQGHVSSGTIEGGKVILLKPQTFMNLSGQSVQAAAAFYKIAPENITVFHDELDLLPAKTRIKKGGGAGGHNGLKSIDAHLGPDYWRVRLGIGHPGDKDMVSPYVLSDFAREDAPWVEALMKALALHAPLLIKDDTDGYMTKVAHDMAPFKAKEKEEETKEKQNGI